uniref:Bulb-type lectin domain-containing protein n=1 Tax=Musa acuminata subsp. malaccensis TaxID=214687 RepID=A0A804HUK0_MUSAM
MAQLLALCLSEFFLLYTFSAHTGVADDSLFRGQSLSGGQTMVSRGGKVELGFFAPDSKNQIWSSNSSSSLASNSSVAVLLDDGNLVLKDNINWFLTSWRNPEDPSPGIYRVRDSAATHYIMLDFTGELRRQRWDNDDKVMLHVCRDSTHGLRMNGHWEITPEGASEEPLYAVGKEIDSSSYPTRSRPPTLCACQPSAVEKSVELLACGIVRQNQELFIFVLTLQNWQIIIIWTGKRRRRLSSVQCQVLLLSLSSSCFWP